MEQGHLTSQNRPGGATRDAFRTFSNPGVSSGVRMSGIYWLSFKPPRASISHSLAPRPSSPRAREHGAGKRDERRDASLPACSRDRAAQSPDSLLGRSSRGLASHSHLAWAPVGQARLRGPSLATDLPPHPNVAALAPRTRSQAGVELRERCVASCTALPRRGRCSRTAAWTSSGRWRRDGARRTRPRARAASA